MDFGAIEVQIFVSLVLVLGALFVALVCDFLKGNNEVLRERNIELVVRQEERQRQAGVAGRRETARAPSPVLQAPQAAPSPRPFAESHVAPVPPPAPPRMESDEDLSDEGSRKWATEQELDEVEEMARRIRSRAVTSGAPDGPAVEPERTGRSTETASGQSQAASVPRAPSTGVSDTAPDPPREVSAVRSGQPGLVTKITPIDVLLAERTAATEALDLARELERMAELNAAADEVIEAAFAGATELPADQAGDDEILPAPEVPAEEPRELPEFPEQATGQDPPADFEPSPVERLEGFAAFAEAVQTAGTAAERIPECKLETPAGYREAAELTTLLERTESFTGTVVAIGVSVLAKPAASDGQAAGVSAPAVPAEDVLRTLLAPADFACPYGNDEYVLVMPNDCGGPAQRRLQYLSQRLWDYQIRSIGGEPVMFSWGSAEGKGELLSLVLDAARTRERAPAEIHRYGRRAASL